MSNNNADTEKNKTEFDPDTAYNDVQFVKFLTESGAASGADIAPEEIREKYELYRSREEVKQGVYDFYSDTVEKSFGIKLDGNDKKAIDEYVDRIAVEDLGKLEELNNTLKSLAETEKTIQELQKELASLGSREDIEKRLGELRERFIGANRSAKFFGLFGKWRERLTAFDGFFGYDQAVRDMAALQYMREKNPELTTVKGVNSLRDQTVVAIEEAKKTLESIGKSEMANDIAKSLFGLIRQNIINVMANSDSIRLSIGEKVKFRLNGMISGKDMTFAKIQGVTTEYRDLLNKRKDNGLGLEQLKPEDETEYLAKLDRAVDDVAIGEMATAISALDIKSSPLLKMEKAIERYLSAKTLGSRDQQAEVSRSMISYLSEVQSALDTSTDSNAKRILIARIIQKIRENKYAKQ